MNMNFNFLMFYIYFDLHFNKKFKFFRMLFGKCSFRRIFVVEIIALNSARVRQDLDQISVICDFAKIKVKNKLCGKLYNNLEMIFAFITYLITSAH